MNSVLQVSVLHLIINCQSDLPVLQAFASLNCLIPYVDAIQRKAVHLDVPTPVVDSLRDILTGTFLYWNYRVPIGVEFPIR